jgi:hypothetical protein
MVVSVAICRIMSWSFSWQVMGDSVE